MIVQPELGLGLELHRAKYVSLSLGAQNKAGVIRYGRNLTHLARDGVYGERENALARTPFLLPLASSSLCYAFQMCLGFIKFRAGAKEMCGLEFGSSSVTNGFGALLSHKGMILRESLKGMKVCL